MEKFVITGGKPLMGEVTISGAKNAAVAILPATLLAAGRCVIENLPSISDVAASVEILHAMGAQVRMLDKHTLEIDTTHIISTEVPNEMSRQMHSDNGSFFRDYQTSFNQTNIIFKLKIKREPRKSRITNYQSANYSDR